MEYEETLERCLMFIDEAHPDGQLEVNEKLLRPRQVELQMGTPRTILAQLQTRAPHLLPLTAHVLETGRTGEIFVLDCSETEHLFRYHVPVKHM